MAGKAGVSDVPVSDVPVSDVPVSDVPDEAERAAARGVKREGMDDLALAGGTEIR
jgi:hypothetical protein